MKKILIALTFLSLITSCTLENMIQKKGPEEAVKIIDSERRKNWPPPFENTNSGYADGTIGGIIQKSFQDHSMLCDFGTVITNRDYIPKDIKLKIEEYQNDTVEVALISIENILFYKFHRREIIETIDEIALAHSRSPQLNFQSKFNFETAEGFPTFLYIGNCTSQIYGELDSDFKPPIGNVSSAIKKDNQKSSKLIIYSGRFVSPLLKVFNSPGDEQMLVLFDLWDFYKANPNFKDSVYYLREFNGIAVKHFSSSSEISKLDVNASANVGMIPMASISGNKSLDKSVQNLFDSKAWKTLIFPNYDEILNPRESFFNLYKNPTYIKNYFLNNVTILEENTPIMKQGTLYKQDLFIEGFPEEKSKNDYWELDSISRNVFQNGSVQVSSNYDRNSRGVNGCKITITGMPTASNFSNSIENDVKVYYRFRTKEAFAVDNEALRIELKNGIIQTDKAPRLSFESFIESEKINIVGDSIVKFKWTLNPIVLDKGNEIDKDILPTIDTLFVQGSDSLKVSLIGSGIQQMNRQTNEYQLSLLTNDRFLISTNVGFIETKKYNLNIVLKLTLPSGRTVKKTITTILSMPDISKTANLIVRE